ncbi:MAG: aminotransferase class III-fold pyridoxal phosphate-dependent enzyme [Pseudomonadota bacterium]
MTLPAIDKQEDKVKLNSRQQLLDYLISSYQKKTQKSKILSASSRDVLADKSSIGIRFNQETKEICYPICVKQAQGSSLIDVDNNKYIDVLMGLGTHLFGHQPGFIKDAIDKQLASGFAIGPQHPLVGETASLVSHLTGMERVSFSNTGTEAVMTAIRVARSAHRGQKIAIFTNSYHGHMDDALVRAPISEYARKKLLKKLGNPELLKYTLDKFSRYKAVPAFPGVSKATATETIVLEYGSKRSLDIIKKQRRQLAAVLVEPVQSRMPELQPAEFLHELRNLTNQYDIALIFDEMVTGFRVAAGGAQEYFGIRADIATYSKIVGGGLPLSVIAGCKRYMDHIDGGTWKFGDESKPDTPTTFFAGTFSKHPLSLACSNAVLTHIKTCGPALYSDLENKTISLVERLNKYCDQNFYPLTFVQYGSFFSIAMSKSNLTNEVPLLLSYLMLIKGIHMRVGDRGGFISTEHSVHDIDNIYLAFCASLDALIEAKIIQAENSE